MSTLNEKIDLAGLQADIAAHPRRHVIEALAEGLQDVDDENGEGGGASYYRSLAYAVVERLPALSYDEGDLCDEPGCGAHNRPARTGVTA